MLPGTIGVLVTVVAEELLILLTGALTVVFTDFASSPELLVIAAFANLSVISFTCIRAAAILRSSPVIPSAWRLSSSVTGSQEQKPDPTNTRSSLARWSHWCGLWSKSVKLSPTESWTRRLLPIWCPRRRRLPNQIKLSDLSERSELGV